MLPEIHAQNVSAPQRDADQALALFNQGKMKEAAAAYEKFLHNYPTSPLASQATFRLGYAEFLLGDYGKSIATLKSVLGPPAPDELQELASSLLGQALEAKASKLKPDAADRTAAYATAIQQFDDFLKKYPKSDQVESVIYGRALAKYQIKKYSDTASDLRLNLQKFPNSASILDTQFLLAVTLATQATLAANSNQPLTPQASGQFTESIKLLKDIIQKQTDVALANDAELQIGDVYYNLAPHQQKNEQAATYAEAVASYRAVQPKDEMVKAQEARITQFKNMKIEALKAKDTPLYKRYDHIQDNEMSKLAQLRSKPDQTVSARIKIGQIYFLQEQPNAARVVLQFMQPFGESATQKKTILYYLTLTYATQVTQTAPPAVAKKAVADYQQFMASYKGDPIAVNLPLVISALYLNPENKALYSPQEALKYLDQSKTMYPDGQFITETLSQEATALMNLKQYDKARKIFQDFLAKKPKRELAASAEFGLATIDKQTGKLANAVKEYKKVRDTYGDLPQGEQAAFWVGQITLQKQPKIAISEFQKFLKKYSKSTLAPAAKFGVAQAQVALGKKDDALKTFQDLANSDPKSNVAPFAYFQMAAIYGDEKKVKKMVGVMRDFIKKYPDNDKIFFAYNSIGQSEIAQGKAPDAIANYQEFVKKYPKDSHTPEVLQKIATLANNAAESLGNYLVLNPHQRKQWKQNVTESEQTVEQLLKQYPQSNEVAVALKTLLSDEKLQLTAQLKTETDVQNYFQKLADSFNQEAATKSKVLFTLAAFVAEKNKAKALALMSLAYNPKLLYAPEDIELYGQALIDSGKPKQAQQVFEKLAGDYPIPKDTPPQKAAPEVQKAQAIALYGIGAAFQKEGKNSEAAAKFDQLKKLYPWSPKILDAEYGIAKNLVAQKQGAKALPIVVQILRSNGAPAQLRADAMLLGGQIQESQGHLDSAIDYYLKVPVFFEGVPAAAAKGLWNGAQLLEKQASTLTEQSKPKKSEQLAKAVAAYQELVKKHPDSPHVAAAKARLQALGK